MRSFVGYEKGINLADGFLNAKHTKNIMTNLLVKVILPQFLHGVSIMSESDRL